LHQAPSISHQFVRRQTDRQAISAFLSIAGTQKNDFQSKGYGRETGKNEGGSEGARISAAEHITKPQLQRQKHLQITLIRHGTVTGSRHANANYHPSTQET